MLFKFLLCLSASNLRLIRHSSNPKSEIRNQIVLALYFSELSTQNAENSRRGLTNCGRLEKNETLSLIYAINQTFKQHPDYFNGVLTDLFRGHLKP